MIGGQAKSSVQTGWWLDIPSSLGLLWKHKNDITEAALQNQAILKVDKPEILLNKGLTCIQKGTQVQVTRISDTKVKVKVLPDGPEKELPLQ